MKHLRLFSIVAALAVLSLLAACGSDDKSDSSKTTITSTAPSTTTATTTTTTTTTVPATTAPSTTTAPATTAPAGGAPGGPPAPSTPGAAAGASAAISIKGFAFTPETIQIGVGTKVTFVNNDEEFHTATSDPGAPSPFDSGKIDLGAGKGFSYTPTQPGTYAYHCAIHPNMEGVLEVS